MSDLELVVWLESFGQPGASLHALRRQMVRVSVEFPSIFRMKIREAERLKEAYDTSK